MSAQSAELELELLDGEGYLAKRLGRYELCFDLASGGMATVYLARMIAPDDVSLERLVALKLIHRHLAKQSEFREMFLDEARIAGHIRHPNVVSVLDVGSDESGPFLVMDYIEGVSLTRLLRAAVQHDEHMPVAVAVRLMHQVALGLDAAHNAETPMGEPLEVVHRDISPHNVMVGFNGVAALTDFGISRAMGRLSEQTSTGILKGKFGYMSPEQLRFEPIDQRADLFSFGVVLFELLSGKRLYRAKPMEEAARRILHEAPPDIEDYRADVPVRLGQLLFRLLAKTPEARPETAREVADVLDAVLDELRSAGDDVDLQRYVELLVGSDRDERRAMLSERWDTPPPVSTPSPAAPPRGRSSWALVVMAVVGLGGLGALAWWIVGAAAIEPAGETEALTAPSVSAPSDERPEVVAESEPVLEPPPEPVEVEAPSASVTSEPSPPARRRSRRDRRSGARRTESRPAADDEIVGW